jgi:hypothetical protein
MSEFLNALLSLPTLPGTVLLTVCAVYWLLLIAGAADLDMLDFDVDAEVDAGSPGWGMAALKFLNVDGVPLMIWLSAFSVAYVAAAVTLDLTTDRGDGLGAVSAAMAAAGAGALLATKLVTQPLHGKFDVVEPNRAETLVGRTCTVTTSQVTEQFGQARLEAEGAPLLLHVRGDAGTLAKNDLAVITGYDPDRQVYFIRPAATHSEPARREAV